MHGPLPNLPKDWQGVDVPPKALEDKPDIAGMQLFIMYGRIGCSHTAIRFHCPAKGALFWDPGGGYGSEGFVAAAKHYDVVTRNVPTVNDYLHWRTLIATEATEVFIWEGNDRGICALYDRIDAASRGIRLDGFTTTTAGLFCSAATSGFLHDYAGRLVAVDKWGLPHNLSKQIYRQGNADRIYIVRHSENTIKLCTPNP